MERTVAKFIYIEIAQLMKEGKSIGFMNKDAMDCFFVWLSSHHPEIEFTGRLIDPQKKGGGQTFSAVYIDERAKITD